MLKTAADTRLFDAPRLFFTLQGNTGSAEVLGHLSGMTSAECRVFESPEQMRAFLENEVGPTEAVVIFDDARLGRKHFHASTQSRPDARLPTWSCGAQWGVHIGQKCQRKDNCARQLAADFGRNFHSRLDNGDFPWGRPRKNENPPLNITLRPSVTRILAHLNSGPDLKAAIADLVHAAELPGDSRISWFRVPDRPMECDTAELMRVLGAMEAFEQANATLLAQRPEIEELLLAGVQLEAELMPYYLNPPSATFSVRRPDLHFTGTGVFASENDEMPGGLPELVHLDDSYGLNADRWHQAFRWLTDNGPLLFIVSHEWSACYIPEIRWLVAKMTEIGYPAQVVTTDQLNQLEITDEGVFFHGSRIGTIWRQFPIFETTGKLADVVKAAHAGRVRLVPEFGQQGNKVWFAIFRRYTEEYRRLLTQEQFAVLDAVLPDSHLVRSASDFPMTVSDIAIPNLDALRHLGEGERDRLVLKIVGANTMAARSYGVLMGHGLSEATWQAWIDERLQMHQPFIVQRRLDTGIMQIPVLNTNLGRPELFHARVLLRPWQIGGNLVSANAVAVPTNSLRVHGRVDMAVVPVVFT